MRLTLKRLSLFETTFSHVYRILVPAQVKAIDFYCAELLSLLNIMHNIFHKLQREILIIRFK